MPQGDACRVDATPVQIAGTDKLKPILEIRCA